MMRSYSGVADFVLIYIAEAHASDEWRFVDGNYSSTLQHKTLEERFDAASQLLSKNIPCPIYVDKMDNAASTLYAALPERLFIIDKGIIVYAGGCGLLHGSVGHKPRDVRKWLDNYVAKDNRKVQEKNGSVPISETCGS